MSHISADAVKALFSLTEVKAADDVVIALNFGGKQGFVEICNEDGTPLTLGQLREMAAAFGAWL